MPTTSTRKSIPKMSDSDPLADVAEAIRDLADKVDELLPLCGQVSVNLVAAANGFVTVTFPASYFSAAPRVVATVNGDTNYYAVVTNVTSSGCRVYVVRPTGATATTTVLADWQAVKA